MPRTNVTLAVLLLLTCAPALRPNPAATAVTRMQASQHNQRERESSEASCRRAVQAFYDWYLPRLEREVHVTAMEQAIRNKPRWFSAELRRVLAEDLAAAKNSPDEIVSLDFEPIVNSQDPASRYVVTKVSRVGPAYRLNVHSVIDGKPSEDPDVVPEVVMWRGHWTFVNFHYPAMERGETGTDLLKLLKQLKADRRKPAVRKR